MKSYKSKSLRKTGTKTVFIIYIIMMNLFIYYLFRFDIVLQNENTEKHILTDDNKTIIPEPEKKEDIFNFGILSKTVLKDQKEENNTQKAMQQSDCIIYIPSINLEKNVFTGLNRLKHLEQYELITATDNMEYKNGGNYIICGHASRLYGHSLNRIKEIQKNDIIYIHTADKKDKYIVYEVSYENMNHTSEYCMQTEERMLTIISCAKYISKESYIIIHARLE